MSDSNLVVSNQLLRTLLRISDGRLLSHLKEISFHPGQILQESGTKIAKVYFPQSGRLARLLVMSDRSVVEINSVGREGLVGLSAILGSEIRQTRTIAQIAGTAIELAVEPLQEEFKHNEKLRELLLVYTKTQLNQISQIAACRTHHDIEQRLARWLLLICDRAENKQLPLTQKFISLMLGVRRATITEIAISFQKQGIIQYSRGQITVLNPTRLESIACECYGKIKAEYKYFIESKLHH